MAIKACISFSGDIAADEKSTEVKDASGVSDFSGDEWLAEAVTAGLATEGRGELPHQYIEPIPRMKPAIIKAKRLRLDSI